MAGNKPLWRHAWFLAEIFAVVNLAFLTFDIYLAHSVNDFRRSAEYIPLAFSIIGPAILIVALFCAGSFEKVWRLAGYIVGGAGVVIGLTGVILHLDSLFFYERTIKALTYSAPFAAPLAYTGLGFLLILNRMVDCDRQEWAQWVLFLTLGGFVGNFVFSVTDHAENGFFNPLEWVAVVASALAVGFLLTPLLVRVSKTYLMLCGAVLLLEAVIGVWGFVLHAERNLGGPSIHAFRNFIYGAPPLAPLLFPNLVLLGLIALWRLWSFAPEGGF
jgi:hypothetical protein